MDAVLTALNALSIAEQDQVMSRALAIRSGSSSTEKPKKVSKKKAESDSEAEPKPKKEQTEGQKAWTNFIKHCQETIQASSEEPKFSYKASMSVASALKKSDKMASATVDDIMEAYKVYRTENPLGESETEKAPATPEKPKKKAAAPEPVKEEEVVVEEKPKKVSKKKAEPKSEPKSEEEVTPAKKATKKTAKAKKSAPFKGPWTHDGVDYLRDDLVVRTLFGDFVGVYDPVKNEIDTSAMEPEEIA
jgi:hypothetical protein